MLRLANAPRPALLELTTDFHLVTEEQGRLVVRSFGSKSTDLARLQWLDSENGQPGSVRNFRIEHVDPETGTQLAGGRWLLLSFHTVLMCRHCGTTMCSPGCPKASRWPATTPATPALVSSRRTRRNT
ncbi:MAG TPA: hypothetical protein VEZ89_00945 [Rubrivivax sp.]|nr:hypothetical protein [Rubrivivax sp.]